MQNSIRFLSSIKGENMVTNYPQPKARNKTMKKLFTIFGTVLFSMVFLAVCFFTTSYAQLLQPDHVADTIHVPGDQPTIQAGIDAAAYGDTVLVASGTYVGNIDFKKKAITVRGDGGPEVTIIEGNLAGSVVTFQSGEGANSVLSGFTVTNGTGTYYEYTPGSSDYFGGGIFCHDSSPTISDCIISGNTTALAGGGIFVYGDNSSGTITNCTITGNSAVSGGGIFCTSESSPTIANCIISNNTAGKDSGGIFCDCNSSPTITNCAISGNSASDEGGGIGCWETSSPTITNCTISSNSGEYGGGIHSEDLASPTVVNSIIWGNSGGGDQIELFDSSSIDITYSDIQGGWTGTGNIDNAPLFVDGGDYHLITASPCIDAGDNNAPGLIETDKDGRPRIINGIVDMGAYEYLGAQTVTGNLVTSDLWIGAVINTEEKGPIEAVWKKGGEDTTSRGDRVIWGHFYASPNDVTWGSQNNPDLFVKIWFDVSGRVDVNYFHVSVPDIEVYSDYPYDGTTDEHGTTTMSRRYIGQYYENGQSYSDENYEDGNPPSGYSPADNPSGYSTINDLRIGSMINTVEKGPIDAVWRLGGQDTTARGDQVVWGLFYASPSDVTWGSQDNPDLFVKIWFDISGRVDVNFFHVSVPDIEVYSDLPSDSTYDQKGTTIMDDRYIRHEYWR